MREEIYRIAADVGTPLALAGITIAFFTQVILRIIDKLEAVRAEHTPEILKNYER